MRKLLLLLLAVFGAHLSLFSQWDTCGYTVAKSNIEDYRPLATGVPDGGSYELWREGVNTARLRLQAYGADGKIRMGWPAAGLAVTDSADVARGALYASGNDTAYVVWAENAHLPNDTTRQLYLQCFIKGQPAWNGGQPLKLSAQADHNHQTPVLLGMPAGGVLVVWQRLDANLTSRSSDLLAQRVQADGNLASGWPSGGLAFAADTLREFNPRLALAGDGQSAYIVYTGGIIEPSGTTLKLYLQKLSLTDGSVAAGWPVSGNEGLQISAGPNVVSAVPEKDLHVLVLPSGNVVILWLEARLSLNGELYSQVVTPAGVLLGPANGQALAGAVSNSGGFVAVQATLSGGLPWVAGTDFPSPGTQIPNVLRLNVDGTLAKRDTLGFSSLPPASVAVFTKIAPDGKGGVYVLYSLLTNNGKELWAKHIHANSAHLTGHEPGQMLGIVTSVNNIFAHEDFYLAPLSDGRAAALWTQDDAGNFNLHACTPDSALKTAVLPLTATETLAAYPNPFKDEIHIRYTGGDEAVASLHDATGREIARQPLVPGTEVHRLALPAPLTPGIYLLQVSGGGNVRTVRMLRTE